MKKLLAVIFSFIALLLLVLITFGIIFAKLLDVDNIKTQLIAIVHNQTGREVVINGDLQRTFFPFLGVKVQQIQFNNAAGFESKQPFASANDIEVRVKVMPLLHKQIEINKIRINGLNVDLLVDAKGNNNWQDLTGKNASNLFAAPVMIQRAQAQTINNRQIIIDTFEINKANISYSNLQNGKQIYISNFNLHSQKIKKDFKFPLKCDFNIASNKPHLNGTISFKTDVNLNVAEQLYNLQNLRFDALLAGKPKFELYTSEIAFDKKQDSLVAPRIILSLGNARAKANVSVKQLSKSPIYAGALYTSEFDLTSLLNQFNINLRVQDPALLKHTALETQFNGNINSVVFNPLLIKADQTIATGYVNVSTAAAGGSSFKLNINQLNIDRFLTTAKPVTAATGILATAYAINAQEPSSNKLRKLSENNIKGTVQVDQLIVSNNLITNFFSEIFIRDGIIKLSPIVATIFSGNANGQVLIDARGSVPSYKVDVNANNIQLHQLLKNSRIQGLVNFSSHLNMQGESKQNLLSSADGSIAFTIRNGVLQGVNIPYQIHRILALVQKQVLPPLPGNDKETRFDSFSGTGIIKNGTMFSNDLLMQSNEFRLTGRGQMNLMSQAINYQLLIVGLTSQNNALQEEKPALPVLMTGTVSHPVLMPDIQAIARGILKERIIEKVEDIKGKGTVNPDNIRNKAGQFLQQLLNH